MTIYSVPTWDSTIAMHRRVVPERKFILISSSTRQWIRTYNYYVTMLKYEHVQTQLCFNQAVCVMCSMLSEVLSLMNARFCAVGILVERLMECPSCRLLTFQGEWLTPKETQGMATRPCEECNDNIDAAFLVQPREKKRGEFTMNWLSFVWTIETKWLKKWCALYIDWRTSLYRYNVYVD